VKITFEKITHTYLLAFPKLKGELILRGLVCNIPSFQNIKIHHAFMAYRISWSFPKL
jgi:hypothetical protein